MTGPDVEAPDETAEQEIARITAILDHGVGDGAACAPKLRRRVFALERYLRRKAELVAAHEIKMRDKAERNEAALNALVDRMQERINELSDERDRLEQEVLVGLALEDSAAERAKYLDLDLARAMALLADAMSALDEKESA